MVHGSMSVSKSVLIGMPEKAVPKSWFFLFGTARYFLGLIGTVRGDRKCP